MQSRIYSLDGLRVLFIIFIFTSHCHLMLRNMFSVQFFFLLSGFVLYYNNKQQTTNNKQQTTKFVYKHIKNIYVLHIITFLIAIFLRQDVIVNYSISDWFANIFLIQSFMENPYTFNYCSWYISVLFVLYWITLPLIKKIRLIENIWPVITIIVILQFIINYYYILYYPKLMFLYSFPLYRVLDFSLGMMVAKIYDEHKCIISEQTFNFYNTVIVILFVVGLIASFYFIETLNYFTILFLPSIYILAYDKGWLCEILKNKYIQLFSKYVLYFYLTHELIIALNERFITNNFSLWISSLIFSMMVAILTKKLIKYVIW